MNLLRILLLSLPTLGFSADLSASDEDNATAKQLIDKVFSSVISANRHYSYTSLLTYEADDSLNTLRLRQTINQHEGGYHVHQELEFLNGISRRVVRSQSLTPCDTGQTRWGLWPDQFNIQTLRQYYNVALHDTERVANRSTILVSLSPKDDLRYEHRFNIDQNTGLIMRSVVLENAAILERTQVLNIDIGQTNAAAMLDEDQSILWRVPETNPCQNEQFSSDWQATWLPDGFVAAGNRITSQGEKILLFTDGLVSISVFITGEQLRDIPKFTARRGATVVVFLPLSNKLGSVAVVGEIPVVTARRIAVSVNAK